MSTAVAIPQNFNFAAPIQSIENFIRFANSIPMLEESEEQALAWRLKQNNDLEAAQTLILSHLRFVIKIARGFNGYGLALADLIQEGNIGLMKAVRRFDPALGVRLVSFAVHWIKSEMHEFILKNWRIVKIATTKAQRKLFFNLRSTKNRLGWSTPEEIAEIAKTLNVSTADVINMEQRLSANDMAFEIESGDSEDYPTYSPVYFLSAPQGYEPETSLLDEENHLAIEKLRACLAQLDERSQDILKQRWLTDNKLTLHELAARYEVSAERVRQLEQQALNKLKKLHLKAG